MRAMIFAAGMGTRLRPLTEHTPKALVEVAGKPLLQRTIEHLKDQGFTDVIVNVHHHASQIIGFLMANDHFGINISISDESDQLLDTGGGLKKASWFFDDDSPFLVINADVVSDLDILSLTEYHVSKSSLATVVIRERPSSRHFLFDTDFRLCGWENIKAGQKIIAVEHEPLSGYPFSGIHIIDPGIFPLIHEEGKFSIVDVYMRIAPTHKIVGYPDNDSVWFDIGDVEKLKKAEEWLGGR